MISIISSFEIINVVIHDSKIFVCISACAVDAAAVNANGIKTLLVNSLSTFFIKGKPVFSSGLRNLPGNLSDCTMLDSWVFSNFILPDKLFAKVLQSLKPCILLNDKLRGKLLLTLKPPVALGKLLRYHFLFLILIY